MGDRDREKGKSERRLREEEVSPRSTKNDFSTRVHFSTSPSHRIAMGRRKAPLTGGRREEVHPAHSPKRFSTKHHFSIPVGATESPGKEEEIYWDRDREKGKRKTERRSQPKVDQKRLFDKSPLFDFS